jgi:hypothetical protein
MKYSMKWRIDLITSFVIYFCLGIASLFYGYTSFEHRLIQLLEIPCTMVWAAFILFKVFFEL